MHVSLVVVGNQSLWLQKLSRDLHEAKEGPTRLFVDNKAVVSWEKKAHKCQIPCYSIGRERWWDKSVALPLRGSISWYTN